MIVRMNLESLDALYESHSRYMVQTFIKNVPLDLVKLKDSIKSHNMESMLSAVHGLKGVCAQLKAIPMLKVCNELEIASKGEDWTGIERLFGDLASQFVELQTYCQKEARITALPSTKAITILLVEDQPVTRTALRTTLSDKSVLQVVAEADNGVTGVNVALELRPDIVLMDIGLPGINGIEATRRFKSTIPNTRVLMLTGTNRDDEIFAALSAGADGYCLKDRSPAQLAAAIQAVYEGVLWLDPSIAKRVLSAFVKTETEPAPVSDALPGSKASLSERELEILSLVVKGLSNKEIADKLIISVDTVKNHMRYVLAKLAVSDRTQAAVKALREGLF